MKYSYQALDQNQRKISGSIEAVGEREAQRLLEEKRLLVVSLELPQRQIELFKKKLDQNEIFVSLFELTTLLESGVSITDAVDSLAESDVHEELLAFYAHLSGQLQQGVALGAAIQSSKLELPNYFVQLVEAGEASGQLAEALHKGVTQLEYDLKVANELRNALVYPAILVLSGLGAVAIIFVFVVPKFANLLTGNSELPALAYLVLSVGIWVNDHILHVALAVGLLVFAVTSQLAKPTVRQKLLDRMATMPVVGLWLADADVARWSSVMGAMLTSRVELIRALALAQKSVKNSARQQALGSVTQAVQSGEPLSKALADQHILSATAYNLIKAGEKSGKLADMLTVVAKIYDNNSRDRMKKVLLMIEPLAIVVIGIMIATIIVGVVQAITSVNDIAI